MSNHLSSMAPKIALNNKSWVFHLGKLESRDRCSIGGIK